MTEREAFEAWAKSEGAPKTDWWVRQLDDGGYSCHAADMAWKAWQAARTQPAQDRSDLWREGYERGMAEGAAYKLGLEDAAKVCEAEQDLAEQEKADKRFKAALAEGDERNAVDRGEHWMAVSTCNAVLRNAAKAIRALGENSDAAIAAAPQPKEQSNGN